MNKGLAAILIFLIFCSLSLRAQYYDTGQDPARLRWEQIRTEHFRVIYPESFASEAEKYAKILEESYLKVSTLYPDARADIPVILHNYSMQSNGYVSWAPRRMELFPLPGQDNLPMDPAVQLAVHEATHVAQLSSLNRGFSRILSVIAGEQIVGLNALMIPQWAFEGDAVYAETAFTASGRGRSNAFMQDVRAIALGEKGIYGYDKMLSGSYRNYTPNHYVFGYLMMNRLRSRSQTAWSDAVSNVSRNSVTLNPVNNSLKRTIGLTKKSLYDVTFDSLMNEWQSDRVTAPEEYKRLNAGNNDDYINHLMPHRTVDGRILSIKTSLSDPPAFVLTDEENGKEHVLTTTGYVYPYIYSYSGSSVVWSELHSNPRWSNLDYSVIKKMNISGGPVTQLTFRSRYTAPDLSPDERTIVAVSTTPDFAYSLVFIDADSGEKLMDLAIPGNSIIQRPAWSSDGKAVTMVTLTPDGEGIRTYFPTGKKWIVNREESRTDIIQAEILNDTLIYLAQGDGSDNIYRIAPDGTESRITHSRFGISGFSVSGSEIVFSDYSATGFKISAVTSGATVNAPVFQTLNIRPAVAEPEAVPEEMPSPENVIIKSGPYRKAFHLFNFHSWLPLYADLDEVQADPSSIKPGFTLMSQNHLSTLFTTLGYEYSNGKHYLHSQIEWRGWYPVIEAGVTYGGEQAVSKPSGITLQPSDRGPDMNFNTSIYLPLYFSYGKFRQLFMPAIYMNYRNRFVYVSDNNAFDEGIVLLTGRLYFSNIFRSAYRDIYPRWGQVIDLRLTSAPWDRDIYSSLKYVTGTLYLPGLARNHSLVIRAGYEDQSPSGILLHFNRNPYPRGYHNLLSEKLFSLSADYTMPLFYPDLAAGSILYLKRIRGSLFFDGATGTGTLEYANNNEFTEGSTDFGSFGGELLADFYLLRFPFEISGGVSGGYIPAHQKAFVEGVLSVNIYGTVLGRKR
jgi:hypothetical protein